MSNELNKSLHDNDVNIILEFKKKWDFSTDIQTKLLTASLSDELNNKGCDCFSNGDTDSAIEFYYKALYIMPINDDAILNLAICYNKKQDYHRAIYNLHKLYLINPINLNKFRTIAYTVIFCIIDKYDSDEGTVSVSTIKYYLENKLSLALYMHDIQDALLKLNSCYNRGILLIAPSTALGMSYQKIYSPDGTDYNNFRSIARAILNWKEN